jgi:hypothetical protein
MKSFVPWIPPLRQHVRGAFANLSWVTRANWIFLLTMTVTWFMFHKKMLPKPMARVASKVFFYPTFPFTAIMRLGNFWTPVDDTVILGCAPMAIFDHPTQLYKMGVRGVVNMCYEYAGPITSYRQLGMKQLHLPTVDHFDPPLEYLKEAVDFIQEHKDRGEKVYVHCKAAHGRGAAVALCWMMKQHPEQSAQVRCAVHVVIVPLQAPFTSCRFY